MKEISPSLEYYGIDISEGGMHKARFFLDTDDKHFIVGNAKIELPFSDGYFDVIFARGHGFYNEHDMDRPSTIEVIERWHRKLKPKCTYYSMFASTPKNMGTYTSMDEVMLPYNRAPRKTDTVDFDGGKYHHTIETFHAPFWGAKNVDVIKYSFVGNQHILLSCLKDE